MMMQLSQDFSLLLFSEETSDIMTGAEVYHITT
jgi:hypothetical protein